MILEKQSKMPAEASYKVHKTIAINVYSQIYSAIREHDGKEFILKKIPTVPATSFERNLIGTLESHQNVMDIDHKFQADGDTVLVMAKAICDLCSVLESIEMENWSPVWPNYYQQLLNGVQHLHLNGIYHCDLKPDNLLLFENGQTVKTLKICDFGLATNRIVIHQRKRGTLGYMSSECFAPNRHATDTYFLGTKNDIWSCGVILINFASLKSPWRFPAFEDPWFAHFYTETQPVISRLVLEKQFKIETAIVPVIQKILNLRPGERPNIKELMIIFAELELIQ